MKKLFAIPSLTKMVTHLAEFVHKKLGGNGRNIYDLGYGSGWMINEENCVIKFS